jgi:hypothetical protein
MMAGAMTFPTWALVVIGAWELCGVVAVAAGVWLLIAALRGGQTRLPKRIASIAGGLFALAAIIGFMRCSSTSQSGPAPQIAD